MGDVFEGVLGAIFLDSNYRLEPLFAVLEILYHSVLPLLDSSALNVPRDPYTSLTTFSRSQFGCKELKLQTINLGGGGNENRNQIKVEVRFHGRLIVSAIASTTDVARQTASQSALDLLRGGSSEAEELKLLCKCRAGENDVLNKKKKFKKGGIQQ